MILVDSHVLIANLRGMEAARDWLTDARTTMGVLAASAVAITEITGDMRSPERREVSRLLSSLRVLPVTETIASHSSVGVVDYLVAATADVHGVPAAGVSHSVNGA